MNQNATHLLAAKLTEILSRLNPKAMTQEKQDLEEVMWSRFDSTSYPVPPKPDECPTINWEGNELIYCDYVVEFSSDISVKQIWSQLKNADRFLASDSHLVEVFLKNRYFSSFLRHTKEDKYRLGIRLDEEIWKVKFGDRNLY